jgi:hypothetical protein
MHFYELLNQAVDRWLSSLEQTVEKDGDRSYINSIK